MQHQAWGTLRLAKTHAEMARERRNQPTICAPDASKIGVFRGAVPGFWGVVPSFSGRSSDKRLGKSDIWSAAPIY